MMKINDMWNQLGEDKSVSNGLILRRYSSDIKHDIYICLKRPENLKCIAISLEKNINIDLSRYTNLKDITIDLVPNEHYSHKNYLLVSFSGLQFGDVFATLCEDLINSIRELANDQVVAQEILNRINKWRGLFEKAKSEGLTPEEQRGLFGELFFLNTWITNSGSFPDHCIKSWLGPERSMRDFQIESWAVEVKTTSGKNHQKIHISNERQLDPTNLKNLFLFHVSLEIQQENGITLNEMVDSVRKMIGSSSVMLMEFEVKLQEYGYFSHHSKQYENTGYQIREDSCFEIRDDFPRIEEKDIKNGVGDLKYSIIITDYGDYIVDTNSVLEILNNYGSAN